MNHPHPCRPGLEWALWCGAAKAAYSYPSSALGGTLGRGCAAWPHPDFCGTTAFHPSYPRLLSTMTPRGSLHFPESRQEGGGGGQRWQGYSTHVKHGIRVVDIYVLQLYFQKSNDSFGMYSCKQLHARDVVHVPQYSALKKSLCTRVCVFRHFRRAKKQIPHAAPLARVGSTTTSQYFRK